MAITREQFEQALTIDQFIERMETNKDRFLENIQLNTLSFDDRQFFNAHPVSIVAFGEDWCTDVIEFLPVVAKIAEEVPAVKLRIFERDADDNLKLMEPYFKEGKFQSIPVFVVYDQDWNELGWFSERPAEVYKIMAAETLRFAKENPHLEGVNRTYENMPEETRTAVRANSANFRWSNQLEWNRMFVDDLKAIVGKSVAAAR
jgi:thiol-disulfide isomerase/thioredoxin